MEALIGMEESQAVTKAFRSEGVRIFSCDLEPCSGGKPDWHIQVDIRKVLPVKALKFLGLHPVCRYLTNSGVRWLVRNAPAPGFEWSEKLKMFVNKKRFEHMRDAAYFFKWCLEQVRAVGCGYVENPVMHKYAREIIGEEYTQIIQPWMFGRMETKKTCLWLTGLPPLQETNNVFKEMMMLDYKDRAKCHYESPGPDREKNRSKTLPEIAEAMATQWAPTIKERQCR